MIVTFTTKQDQQPVSGQMSIWHRCDSAFGNVGETF
jgi:hypothetical protein